MRQIEMVENKRVVPINTLDYQWMTVETDWGKTEIPESLKRALSKEMKIEILDENGQQKAVVTYEDVAWELLSFYRKEMRLANLTSEQLNYCQYYIDLAGDCLTYSLRLPFLTSLRYATTVLELSQSRKGFLRRLLNTVRQETSYKEETEKKKSIFGTKKEGY